MERIHTEDQVLEIGADALLSVPRDQTYNAWRLSRTVTAAGGKSRPRLRPRGLEESSAAS